MSQDLHARAPQPAAPSNAAPASTAPASAAIVQRKAALRGQPLAVQLERLAPGSAAEGGAQDVQAIAAEGVAGSGGSLPHGAAIQKSFGGHDLGGVRAHTGGQAGQASAAIGAKAYASGDHVAFDGAPDMHTAAHEAAHIIQQKQGVQLSGGVGQAGDRYEQQADAVADAVVAGKSAEGLLGAPSGGSARAGGAAGPVQRKLAFDGKTNYLDAATNSKLSRFGVLVDMQSKCNTALGETVTIGVSEEKRAGAAAAFIPREKRVAIAPMPEANEGDKATLNGMEVTDRAIALSHELQHVFDAYDPNGSFDLREAMQAPAADNWQQTVRSEWHSHARQAKAAKEQSDQDRKVPVRHSGLLKAWTKDTFDRAKSDPTDGMFKWTRDYIGLYKYQGKKAATDDETERFITSKASWVGEAFAILPAQG
ncbi:MAG: DUF4157 domain-containing protein [Myxococcota bacterium]